jgi:hypothetical protein
MALGGPGDLAHPEYRARCSRPHPWRQRRRRGRCRGRATDGHRHRWFSLLRRLGESPTDSPRVGSTSVQTLRCRPSPPHQPSPQHLRVSSDLGVPAEHRVASEVPRELTQLQKRNAERTPTQICAPVSPATAARQRARSPTCACRPGDSVSRGPRPLWLPTPFRSLPPRSGPRRDDSPAPGDRSGYIEYGPRATSALISPRLAGAALAIIAGYPNASNLLGIAPSRSFARFAAGGRTLCSGAVAV